MSGATVADTIGAFFVSPLIVELRDPNDRLVAGASVHFTARPTTDSTRRAEKTLLIGPLGASSLGDSTSVFTDANGRAQISIRAGTIAGLTAIDISAFDGTVVTSSPMTVSPGATVRINEKTGFAIMEVNGTAKLDAQVFDRANNITTTANFSVDTTLATIDSDGTVHARSKTGAAQVIVRSGAVLSQRFQISVVPVARIVASRRTGDFTGSLDLVSMGLDGKHVQSILGPELAPSGIHRNYYDMFALPTGVVYYIRDEGIESHIWVRDATGANRRLTSSAVATSGEQSPVPSTDGAWIYFIAESPTSNPTIWRIRSDGTAEEQFGPTLEKSRLLPWYDNLTVDPDGTAIYARLFDPAHSPRTMRIDLATRRVSANAISSNSGLPFSPARDKLAYSFQNGGFTVRTIASAKEISFYSQFASYTFSSSPFSADGKWIVITSPTGALAILDTEAGVFINCSGGGYLVGGAQWMQ